MMENILAQVRSSGYEATGISTDAEAVKLIREENFQVVVIGGGVEQAARKIFRVECAAKTPSPVFLEIFGPDTLLPRLNEVARQLEAK